MGTEEDAWPRLASYSCSAKLSGCDALPRSSRRQRHSLTHAGKRRVTRRLTDSSAYEIVQAAGAAALASCLALADALFTGRAGAFASSLALV